MNMTDKSERLEKGQQKDGDGLHIEIRDSQRDRESHYRVEEGGHLEFGYFWKFKGREVKEEKQRRRKIEDIKVTYGKGKIGAVESVR